MSTKSLLASITLGAAAGVAYYFLKKKTVSAPSASGSKQAEAASKSAPSSPKNSATASYSFISGFRDASTVELSFPYDADRFCFDVREDEFLAESGDSHVGVLSGELFSAQFEYAAYYSGEDFQQLTSGLKERHRDLVSVCYGPHSGVMFRSGDILTLLFPITDDSYSYLHITLMKAPDNDDELEMLPDYQDVKDILSSMVFERT